MSFLPNSEYFLNVFNFNNYLFSAKLGSGVKNLIILFQIEATQTCYGRFLVNKKVIKHNWLWFMAAKINISKKGLFE